MITNNLNHHIRIKTTCWLTYHRKTGKAYLSCKAIWNKNTSGMLVTFIALFDGESLDLTYASTGQHCVKTFELLEKNSWRVSTHKDVLNLLNELS